MAAVMLTNWVNRWQCDLICAEALTFAGAAIQGAHSTGSVGDCPHVGETRNSHNEVIRTKPETPQHVG